MFTIELVPNTGCNFGCYFCFAHKKDNTKVDPKNLDFVLENLHNLTHDKEIFIKIYGGEVMIEQNVLKEVLTIIKNKKNNIDDKYLLTVAIVTNFSIFPSDELFSLMNELNVDLIVSMEINEKYHNKIRYFKNDPSLDSFSIVMGNIERYIDKTNKTVSIQTVLSPECIIHMDEYLDFIDRYKNNRKLRFLFVPMFGKNEITNESLLCMEDSMKKYRNYLSKNLDEGYKSITIFHEFRSIVALYLVLKGQYTPTHCSAGHSQITLVGDNYYPCSKFFHNNYESFKYDKEDIITSFNYDKEKMHSLVVHDIDCLNCQKLNKFGCTGRCILTNLKNDMNNEESICEYNKHLGKHAMEIFKESLQNEKLYNILSKMSEFIVDIKYEDIIKVLRRVI